MYENFLLLWKVVLIADMHSACIFPLKETYTGRGVSENKLLYLIIYIVLKISFLINEFE